MPITLQSRKVKRYFVQGEFNPRSKDQLLAYVESKGLQAGPAGGKSGKPTLDKKVLDALAKKDPFFQEILNLRAIEKVESTYVEGTLRRIDSEARLHASFKHRPSTMRLSCQNPNLQNVVGDKVKDSPASGFKRSIIAAPGCKLIEADFAAIEAVLTGYYMQDPQFMRLAKLGIHSYHASHVIGQPVDLSLPDVELGQALKAIKALDKFQYDKSKTCVYGVLFGQGAWGLHKTWPELFPTLSSAQANQNLLYKLCANLPKWHDELRALAHKQGYLGGSAHPFNYRHWFWDVYSWNPKKQKYDFGRDSKRVVAYFPQSTAAGIIKEAAVRVASQIETFFFGQSPFRALIHDSILCEVEDQYVDEAIGILHREMTRPIPELPCPPEWGFGSHLAIGVSIKVGQNWGEMKEVSSEEIGIASDTAVYEEEEEDNG